MSEADMLWQLLPFRLIVALERAVPCPEPPPDRPRLGLTITFDSSDGSITVPISRYQDMPTEKQWPVGSGPHTCHVGATAQGQPAPDVTIQVTAVNFDTQEIFGAIDDPADPTAVTFTDLGKEGSTVATITATVSRGAESRELSGDLMLTATAAPAPPTPLPDALDFRFDDDAPAPALGTRPAAAGQAKSSGFSRR
jgi:hypothetical protein